MFLVLIFSLVFCWSALVILLNIVVSLTYTDISVLTFVHHYPTVEECDATEAEMHLNADYQNPSKCYHSKNYN